MGASYKVMKVSSSDRSLVRDYAATIEGKQDISILPQVAGQITKLCVTEGQEVKKNQPLFIIDQVPYQAALRTAKANVKAAEAGVATAQLSYESNKKLFNQKVVSSYTLQTAHNAYLTANAQLTQAEAARVNAANSLSYTVVKSPSNGVVGALPYRVGTLVSPSMTTPLTKVTDISEMYVYFSMNETEVLKMIRQYGSLNEALKKLEDVQLKLSDGSVYEEKGRIASISGVIDPATGSVTLRAVFPNEKRLLHSGASGALLLPYELKNMVFVPQLATYELQDKVFVYQIVEGKAKAKMINVYSINDGKDYAVTSGLKEGEEIIVEGVSMIRDGMPVTAKK
ncbi:MAG: efflux RND transporter periplasmic adaptor subunit [Massilibacteroides sp.]|nr:efflux RND transporter periplasmic adaptor subunit [Massilibacteroides sp.]